MGQYVYEQCLRVLPQLKNIGTTAREPVLDYRYLLIKQDDRHVCDTEDPGLTWVSETQANLFPQVAQEICDRLIAAGLCPAKHLLG